MNTTGTGGMVGVGQSASHDVREAAEEATRMALEAIGTRTPSATLVFATTGYDQDELISEIHRLTGGIPLSGCSGAGVITKTGSDEGSHALGVMVLAIDGMSAATLLAEGSDDAQRCGDRLAEQAARAGVHAPRALLLFADGLSTNCTALLARLRERLPFRVEVVGGTAADAFSLSKTYQYRDGRVSSNSVAALLIGGDVGVEIAVSHGCEPLGIQQTITEATDDGWVSKIDDKPAWDFFRDYLPEDAQSLDVLNVAFLCLAEQLPEKTPYGDVIIRVPVALKQETGALFFPGGLRTGTGVRVAMRRWEHVTTRALETVRELSQRRRAAPLALLQFDCLGRGRLLLGDAASAKLMLPMQRAMPHDVPWLGLHTFGEIAPVGSQAYLHNFTVARCALYAERAPKPA